MPTLPAADDLAAPPAAGVDCPEVFATPNLAKGGLAAAIAAVKATLLP